MTDFTESMAEAISAESNANSPAGVEYESAKREDKAAEDKRIYSQFQSAYDQTDLSVSGPSREKYDYPSDFSEGNTFKPDSDGGVQINNRHYKQGEVDVAGFDLTTGKQYRNKYTDADGRIKEGVKQLRQEDSNTKTGPSYRHVDGLHSVARGILSEGGTFDDFTQDAKGPWSMDQMAASWRTAEATNRTMQDIDSGGERFKGIEPPEGEIPGLVQLPDKAYMEEDMVGNKEWLDSGRRFLSHFRGDNTESMSDEDVNDMMKTTMAMNKWNLPLMMYFANEVQETNDPKFALDFINLMDQYDHLEYSMAGTGRAAIGLLSDPVTYLTFGGGAAIARPAMVAIKQGVKGSLKAVAMGTAYDTTIGAAEGAVMSYTRQQAEAAAGGEKVSASKTAVDAAITGTIVGMIGTPINIMANKTARGVMVDKAKGAYDWLKDVDWHRPLYDIDATLDMMDAKTVDSVARQMGFKNAEDMSRFVETDVAGDINYKTIAEQAKAKKVQKRGPDGKFTK